jgi:peptidyl-prolyl cis-trans isomerase B (cyclophilin B)
LTINIEESKMLQSHKKGFNVRGELKIYDLPQEELQKLNYVKISTSKGVLWLRLLNEETPNTVANFASLVKDGFYNGLKFHRVISGFMAQGGCPLGTGTGGPGWRIPCETALNKTRHRTGVLSMAHAGPNTGGSQFFICFVDCPHLDGVHTVFGHIEEGDKESFEVLSSIRQEDIMESLEIFETKE